MQRNNFFPIVVYETWSLILKEEHRLSMCENSAVEGIGSNRRWEKIA
jgi:hypothetical protein